MNHIDLLRGHDTDMHSEREAMLTKATGRYYTHELVGHHLISALVDHLHVTEEDRVRVIDPFCGDGRLVVWFLEAAVRRCVSRNLRWRIALWDCDAKAIMVAHRNVQRAASDLGLEVDISSHVGDSFSTAPTFFDSFEVVITNPPWELLKPDRRELHRLGDSAQEYVEHLRTFDRQLAASYPLSQPLRKFSGWGTNLARCGVEVAVRLTAHGGLCGIVSPASLLADQMTIGLRQWLFERHSVRDIAYFPAEAKLFPGADQACITALLQKEEPLRFQSELTVYSREQRVESKSQIELDWRQLKDNGFSISASYGTDGLALMEMWRALPTFSNLEAADNGLWAGRELDETGHESYLGLDGQYRFTKGRMISRFSIVEQPNRYVRTDGPRIPWSADYHRIAWRDVSRPTQKRRIQATIIPPKWVTGNSLHVALFREENPLRLKWLLSVLNSLPFEFQVRSSLATGHISLGVVRQSRIPPEPSGHLLTQIASLVDQSIAGDPTSQAKLEAVVAREYGLSRPQFAKLLAMFPKLTSQERDLYLSQFER